MPIYEPYDINFPTGPPPDLPPRNSPVDEVYLRECQHSASDRDRVITYTFESLSPSKRVVTKRQYFVLTANSIFFAIIFCFLLVYLLIPKEELEDCPPGYQYFDRTDSCYRVSLEPVPFEKARKTCEVDGSHLVSIHSQDETNFLVKIYNESLEKSKDVVYISQERISSWIGLVFVNGKWEWTDGSEVDYEHWAKGEPNRMGNNDFFTFLVFGGEAGYNPNGDMWSKDKNSSFRRTICKMPSQKSHCDLGYTLAPIIDFCYKVKLSEVSFEEANKSCESEGANLASVHSSEENSFLRSLYLQNLADYMKHVDSHKDRSNVWIGLVYKDKQWQWTDHTPLNFTKWARPEPNFLESEPVTELITSKWDGYSEDGDEWNNVEPVRKRAFLCKKPSRKVGKSMITNSK